MLLKAVIFSISDVILPRTDNPADQEIKRQTRKELTKLFDFLTNNGIKIVFSTNRNRNVHQSDGTIETLDDFLTRSWPKSKHYCAELNNNIPNKQTGLAIQYILNDLKINKNEIIYVGRSDDDLQAAANGKVLFLNATWYQPVNNYGFLFSSPKEIAKFIGVFCLREHCWGWKAEFGDAKYYALAPFSTFKEDFRFYSQEAKNQAKLTIGNSDFWFKYLASSIYFSGLSENANFITTYVGHSHVSPYKLGSIMEIELRGLAVCFRGKFLKDLFYRHITAEKSQYIRQAGRDVAITNQINSVHVNRLPVKNLTTNERYVNPPNLKNKTVIVIDDFCTEGNAHETARLYLESLGAKVISISWLKTINTDVKIYRPLIKLLPFKVNTCKPDNFELAAVLDYKNNLITKDASGELSAKIKEYNDWDWPV